MTDEIETISVGLAPVIADGANSANVTNCAPRATSKTSIRGTGRNGVPERSLWRAVLARAFSDAQSKLLFGVNSKFDSLPTPEERLEIRAWLTDNNPDFIEVCELADLEPDRVRAHALGLAENDWVDHE